MDVGIGACCGMVALPIISGVACLALACRYLVFGIDEREDRISQLPDNIICSIVSRLCTRDAVRTSLLSTRWRHVYTSIYRVRFACWDIYKHKACFCHSNRMKEKLCKSQSSKFAAGVNTFLQHHSGSKIMSFELVYCYSGMSDSFTKWMTNSVGTLGVEQLTFGFCCRDNLHDPQRLAFSTNLLPESSSVKHLRLRGCSFLAPNRNALQVLELDGVTFTSETVGSILSNCSRLQVLNLRHCVLPSELRIHGPDLQLKSLMISQCKNVTMIYLSAINLCTFEIICKFIKPTVYFSHVPLLKKFIFEFSCTSISPHLFEAIAKDLPHLETLVLKNHAITFSEDGVISKLSNLKQLVLVLESNNRLDLLQIFSVLDACPHLHKFQLSMLSQSTFSRERAKQRAFRRDTRLKQVEFHGFRETESEYGFILYILKTFAALERLVISGRTLSCTERVRRWMDTVADPRNDDKRCGTIIPQQLREEAISKHVEIITL